MIAEEVFESLQLSVQENQLIREKLKPISVAKGATLLYPDDNVKYQYFVISGCLRSFFIDNTAKEHTIQFAIKDWWISDYTAFFKQEKAILQIECIKAASLFQFSRDDMDELFEHIPKIEHFFRLKTESYISSFQKRIIGDLAKTAKERYLDFISTYPNIEQEVKNYHIASYLGITSESLSRIRREIAMH